MAERSAAALHWLVVPLAVWGLTRLFPPTGTRRKAPTAIRAVVTGKNVRDHAGLVARVSAQRRSPYSTDRQALDGSASRLSRPYLPALAGCWAQEARFHLDLDTHDIRTAVPVEGVAR